MAVDASDQAIYCSLQPNPAGFFPRRCPTYMRPVGDAQKNPGGRATEAVAVFVGAFAAPVMKIPGGPCCLVRNVGLPLLVSHTRALLSSADTDEQVSTSEKHPGVAVSRPEVEDGDAARQRIGGTKTCFEAAFLLA